MNKDNDIKVVLVTRDEIPITVGVGTYPFEIKDNKIVHNVSCQLGSSINGQIDDYNEAYELARLAWEIQEFDNVEAH